MRTFASLALLALASALGAVLLPNGPPAGSDAAAARLSGGAFPIEKVRVQLVSPKPNAVMPQNVASTGCPANPTRGYGTAIEFEWKANHDEAVAAYELVVQHLGSPLRHVDVTVTEPRYTDVDCNGFVIRANLDHWEWRVRPIDEHGDAGAWVHRPFSFAPCILPDGSDCYAP